MGFKVGPYMVTDTLGQGTFGKVKLAQHEESGIEYAIKIMDKNSITQNELTLNVRREIAIMKALNHRNIVNLRDVLSSRTKLYLVMDLVQGGELFDEIERRGKLGTKLARKYFQELVDGIDYCHQRGVFHRDLKPENLLVDSSGTLKITDFGVSSMNGGQANENDVCYTACGTPYYCAPEIINGTEGGYSGVKIDSWSCGIILYLLLTGNLPFQSETMKTLYEQINNAKVWYPSWMEKDAKHLISNLLKKDPNERFSLQDVIKHPWFLVDYEHHEPDSGRNNSSGNRLGRRHGSNSNNSSSSSSSSKDGRRSGSSKGQRSSQKVRRSSESLQAGNIAVDNNNSDLSESSEVHQRPPLQPVEAGNISAKKLAESLPEVPPRLPPLQYAVPEKPLPEAPLRAPVPSTEEHKEVPVSSSSSGAPPGMSANPVVPAVSVAQEKAKTLPMSMEKQEEKPSKVFVQKDISEYEDQELSVLIHAILPGKPAKRIESVVSQLEELDMDCAEDLSFLASNLETPAALTTWLEEKTGLKPITCMRIAKFLFK